MSAESGVLERRLEAVVDRIVQGRLVKEKSKAWSGDAARIIWKLLVSEKWTPWFNRGVFVLECSDDTCGFFVLQDQDPSLPHPSPEWQCSSYSS